MAPEKKKELTPEEVERKDRVRLRLFILLICLDILLAGYLVFEMIIIITKATGKNNNQEAAVGLMALRDIIRNCL